MSQGDKSTRPDFVLLLPYCYSRYGDNSLLLDQQIMLQEEKSRNDFVTKQVTGRVALEVSCRDV